MSRKRNYLWLSISILCLSFPALAAPVATSASDADSLYKRGKCFVESCKGIKKQPRKGRELLEEASNQSHGAAQFYLGSLEAADNNNARAILLYRAAANNGDADGQTATALHHVEQGIRLVHQPKEQEAHYQEAIRWLKKAVDQGHAEAKFWYGDMLTKGIGIHKDVALGRKYLTQSAEAGNMNGMSMVAYYLATGEMGFKKNPEKAYAYAYASLKKGNENARNVLPFAENELTKEQIRSIRKKVEANLESDRIGSIL